MEQIFREIRAAVQNEAWILALFGILAVPDICAALGSEDGKTNGKKYKDWIDANLSQKYPLLDAGEFWQMRNSMLHEGASSTKNYTRVIFVAPNSSHFFHGNVLDDALNLDLPTFAQDMIEAASDWLSVNRESGPVKTNLAKLVRWYPDGISPYISGVPVLT